MNFKEITFNDIPSWPKARKLLALVIINGILLLLSFLLIILPQYSVLSSRKKQEIDLKQQLIMLVAQTSVEQKEELQLQALKKMITEHNNHLVKSENLGSVLDDLNTAVSKNELDLLNLKPQPSQKEGYYTRVPIALKAQGDFFHIAEFLSQIAHMGYYLYPSELQIISSVPTSNLKGQQSNVDSNSLSLELTVDMYSFTPPSPAELANAAKKSKGGKK